MSGVDGEDTGRGDAGRGDTSRQDADGRSFGRRRPVLFWTGTAMVTAGVVLHLPMYIQARDMKYHMAGMKMDASMVTGMVLIVAGLLAAGYGLLPRRADYGRAAGLRVRALDDAPLGATHVGLLLVLAAAVTIDVMKPTSLAFVVPGFAKEYGLKTALNPHGSHPAALLPLFGITGTVLGSLIWGWLGDRMGRRAAMLLAGVLFVGTSICGTMPGYKLNLLMCFIMGLGAGGMLPVAFTLLSETIPARHRGWLMVLIGGDIAGAYVLTSWASESLTPTYSWRVLWLLGLPTGLLFILLTRWIPESPRFLLAVGKEDEARRVLKRYGAEIVPIETSELAVEKDVKAGYAQLLRSPFLGLTLVLALVGGGIGLVLYGFQLWLPTNLRHLGYTGVTADRVLRDSSLIGFPLNLLVAYLYHRSSRWTLIGLSAVVAAALLGFVAMGDSVADDKAVLRVLLVVPIWGASSVVAVLSAYGAEVYPTRIRSRGSGLAAGMTKAGGVLVIAMVVSAVAVPSVRTTALLGAVPLALAVVLAIAVAIETRHRRLEDITGAELGAESAPV
ncbi:MFS transporter [Actinomadura rupiterrae]|uniref:MFS transporter n=1 Tax=Actinomadura rupiterrae TaxID=559627 RepID=UPI0020A3F45D|nr:MFS transporter [Actinomadura rupiterrae]MCP2336100.1 putative MFS transporter [Actinomadura rupiterrae]